MKKMSFDCAQDEAQDEQCAQSEQVSEKRPDPQALLAFFEACADWMIEQGLTPTLTLPQISAGAEYLGEELKVEEVTA